MVVPEHSPVIFRLDAQDRIVDVGGNWDRFACDNNAEEMMGNAVLGFPLRRFVSGDITRMFLDTMLMRVRVAGKPVTTAYRCDSPGLKRQMEMTLTPEGKDILTTHRIVTVEHLPRPLRFISAADGSRRRLVKRCSMCARLAFPGGATMSPEDYDSAQDSGLLSVIYDICTRCRARWQSP